MLLALSVLPLGAPPALAAATSLVTEAPSLAGQTIWTNAMQTPLEVTADNSVTSVQAIFAGCPPVCGQGGISPAQQVPLPPNRTALHYNVYPFPGMAPQPLTVSYAVYGQVYRDTASLGLDQSLIEPGAPGMSPVSFTVFPHGSATIDPSTIAVTYNGSPVAALIVTAGPIAGSFTVSFSPVGVVSGGAPVGVTYSDSAGNDYNLGFQPSTAPQWLQGSVVDQSGAPVPGIQVMAFGSGPGGGGGNPGQTYTGADGGFIIPLSGTGSYIIQVQPQPGQSFVAATATADVSGPGPSLVSPIRLQLPQVTVTGVVYDGTNNQPVGNALVNLSQAQAPQSGPGGGGSSGPPPGGSSVTNAAGQYTVYLPAAGQYDLMVQPPFGSNPDNLQAAGPTREDLPTGASSIDVTLPVAAATVSGAVYYNGAAVPNAGIQAMEAPSGPGVPGGFAFAQTDSSGRYTLQLGAGTWQIQVGGSAGGASLQGLRLQQFVTPTAALAGGSLTIGSASGQQITDNLTLAAYDVPVDVGVEVGAAAPAHLFVFAQQGPPPGGGSGPGSGPGSGGPGGPGLFASDQQNSDGSPNTDWVTLHHVHLLLTAGAWQVGVGVSTGSAPPRFKMVSLTITGTAPSATVTANGGGAGVTVGTPPVLSLSLHALDQVATVTVLDGSGNPVQGAFVGAFKNGGDFLQGDNNPPVTDASGRETIHLTASHWNVATFASGYGFSQPQALDTSAGSGSYALTFNLGTPRPYTISGTVTRSGIGVPGAQVVATQPGQPPAFGVTDPFGSYSLSVTGGSWSLAARTPGYDTSAIAPVPTSAPLSSGNMAETVNLDITAATQRNIQLSGTVVDGGGNPVAGATVQATLGGTFPATAVTAGDGTWKLAVSAGTWSVSATAPGYTPSTPQGVATTGTTTGITLALGTQLADTVTGTVTGTASAPVQNALVTAVNTSTHVVFQALTGSDGSYTLQVADGSYDVGANAVGYVTAGPVILSSSGGSTTTQNFQLSTGVGVSGTVTVGGTAAAGVEVDAASVADPAVVLTTTTDGSGIYSLGVTAGSWTLTAYSAATHTPSAPATVTVATTPLTGENLSIP